MDIPGDAQATGQVGLSESQAAEALERLLAGDGDSEADETLEEPKKPLKASSEDDDGEEAEAADEEESEDAESDEDSDDEQPQTFTVKVDGKDVAVTLDELTKGYSREQDYTRKTMALGEDRKAVETEKATISQKRTEYETALKQIEDFFANSGLPDDDSDIAHLRYADPAEWSAQMQERGAQRDAARQRAAAIAAERARITEEKTTEERERLAERGKDEAEKLKAAIPDWSDPEKAKADTAMIAKYAKDVGITPDELNDLMDHRLVVALRDAAKYRALQAKKPEVQKRLDVKPAKPGTTTQRQVSDLTRSKQRLAKTGRVEDAATALLHILG